MHIKCHYSRYSQNCESNTYTQEDEIYLVGNYRPISLLSTLNKLMEKLMYTRVIQFLSKYKISYKYQIGF